MSNIKFVSEVRFHGLLDDKNASALCGVDGLIFVATDEPTSGGNVVQVLRPSGDDFALDPTRTVLLDPSVSQKKEMDIEGLAADGHTIYVVGSHSAKRKKVDPDKTCKTNRKALTSPVEAQPSRDVLLRFDWKDDGEPVEIESTTLRNVFEKTEPFATFQSIGSKENGIDIEGIAVYQKQVYVGFRGPVLRGNFAVVLKFGFGQPVKKPTPLFVNLGGRGIRDLATVKKGLLILVGPVGDGPGSYQIYFWDGQDGVPGSDVPISMSKPGLQLIGDLPAIGAADAVGSEPKPEGMMILNDKETSWEVLIVCDGLKNGHALKFQVKLPKPV